MTFDLSETELLQLWVDSLLEYGALCRGKAAAALRGKYVKRFDGQGLDPISSAYGRVQALQALHPLLEEPLLTPNPVEINSGCREDMLDEFRRELMDEAQALKRVTKEKPE